MFNSTSPHLGDYSANQYALDYTLNGEHPASLFVVGECHKCFTRYAIVADPLTSNLWMFDYETHARPPLLAEVSSEKPVCINPKCRAALLDITSLASMVTRDGMWLKLDKRVITG